MFMEAPNYAVMVVARFTQGISSSVIWVVGLALLLVSKSLFFFDKRSNKDFRADVVPEEMLGRQ